MITPTWLGACYIGRRWEVAGGEAEAGGVKMRFCDSRCMRLVQPALCKNKDDRVDSMMRNGRVLVCVFVICVAWQ